jgi:hypothetical protein
MSRLRPGYVEALSSDATLIDRTRNQSRLGFRKKNLHVWILTNAAGSDDSIEAPVE